MFAQLMMWVGPMIPYIIIFIIIMVVVNWLCDTKPGEMICPVVWSGIKWVTGLIWSGISGLFSALG